MDAEVVGRAVFVSVTWLLGAVVCLCLAAVVGVWMDDAFRSERWVWFCGLLIVLFPASLIARVVDRARAEPTSSLTD